MGPHPWVCCCVEGGQCICKYPYLDSLGYTHTIHWDVTGTFTPASCATIKTLAGCPTFNECTAGFRAASTTSWTVPPIVVPNLAQNCVPYVPSVQCCGMFQTINGPTVNFYNWFGDCCNTRTCIANGGQCCAQDPFPFPLLPWQASVNIRFPDPANGFNKWEAICSLTGMNGSGGIATATYELNTTSCNISNTGWTLVSNTFANGGPTVSSPFYWIDGTSFTLGGFYIVRTP